MQEFQLKNNIKAVFKQNKNTPRIGLCLNISINDAENLAGEYCLMSRLLLQGTKNRTSEELAVELDENAIDLCAEMKQDYLRFKLVCLNEDFSHAIEIMSDVIKNSTFEEFEKEKAKMQGEIVAELDSARTKALDNFYKTLFDGHFYGHTYTKMLEVLDKITKEDVIKAYENIISTGKKVLSLVGDTDFSQAQELLNKEFGDISNESLKEKSISTPFIKEFIKTEVIKNDAQQAQIIQGWIVPNFKNQDYAALLLLNVILGSAGLSSRLFLELRDKKGLAYHVRSNYENNELCANFNIYIATEPKNVQTCLEGFETEINKLKETPVSEDELRNAKNNYIGKQQFMTETNSQQANQLAYYGIMDLGFDFQDENFEKIKAVNVSDIQRAARNYLDQKSVVSILRP